MKTSENLYKLILFFRNLKAHCVFFIRIELITQGFELSRGSDLGVSELEEV